MYYLEQTIFIVHKNNILPVKRYIVDLSLLSLPGFWFGVSEQYDNDSIGREGDETGDNSNVNL